jgi:glycosyltransferase involved in cell wall biosynthesis
MIAYFLPPAGSVGVYRTLKFMKYLPEFGWQPVALTTANGKFPKYDEGLLALIPEGVAVHRCRGWEWLNEGENARSRGPRGRRTLWSRIHTRLYLTWHALVVPDTRVTWVPAAVAAARRIVRREGIRHVYISGSPFSSFLIGALLKRSDDVRVIVDYRDPWTQNITYPRRARFLQWLDRRLEQWVVRRADVVVSNTRHNDERMFEAFGAAQPRDKFIAVHNGFDGEDFAGVARERNERFTITYAGAFYYSVGSDFGKAAGNEIMETYSPLYFFAALEKLFARRPEVKTRFAVNFMGVLGEGYDAAIRERGLEGVIHRLGYLSYDEHLRVLGNADALLLVLSRGERSRGWIPSKFFQYLGTGNAIVALAPGGEVRDIMRETRAGICVDPDDVDGAAAELERLYDAWVERKPLVAVDRVGASAYERRNLTALLARALDSC